MNGKFRWVKKSNRKNDLKNIKGINTRWSIFKGLEWQIQSRISGVFPKFFYKNRVFRSFSIKEFFPKKLYKKIAPGKFSARCDFSTGRPTEKSDHPNGKRGKSIWRIFARCVFVFGRLTDKTEPPGAKVQTYLKANLIYQVFPMLKEKKRT